MKGWERKVPVALAYKPVPDGPLPDPVLERLRRMDRGTLLQYVDVSITKIVQMTDEYRRSGEAAAAVEAQKEALSLAQALACLPGPL